MCVLCDEGRLNAADVAKGALMLAPDFATLPPSLRFAFAPLIAALEKKALPGMTLAASVGSLALSKSRKVVSAASGAVAAGAESLGVKQMSVGDVYRSLLSAVRPVAVPAIVSMDPSQDAVSRRRCAG